MNRYEFSLVYDQETDDEVTLRWQQTNWLSATSTPQGFRGISPADIGPQSVAQSSTSKFQVDAWQYCRQTLLSFGYAASSAMWQPFPHMAPASS